MICFCRLTLWPWPCMNQTYRLSNCRIICRRKTNYFCILKIWKSRYVFAFVTHQNNGLSVSHQPCHKLNDWKATIILHRWSLSELDFVFFFFYLGTIYDLMFIKYLLNLYGLKNKMEYWRDNTRVYIDPERKVYLNYSRYTLVIQRTDLKDYLKLNKSL